MTAAAASTDGRYVATGAADGTVVIWSATTFLETSLVEFQPSGGYYEPISSLSFSDTGNFLAATQGSDVHIWRISDNSPITSVRGPGSRGQDALFSCAWRRDSLEHVSLSVFGYTNYLWFTKAKVHSSWTYVHDAHYPASFTPPLYSYSGMIFIVQSSTGRFVAEGFHTVCLIKHMTASGGGYYNWPRCRLTYKHSDEFDVDPTCANFAGDDRFVICFSDGTIRWWDIVPSNFTTWPSDLPTVQPCGVLTLYPTATNLSASPLGSFLLAWSSYGDTTVTLLGRGLDDSVTPHTFLRGHTGRVNAACVSGCERYVATASEDTTVRLWSVRDGSLFRMFVNHDAPATHVVLSPDGRILASGDRDGIVCLHVLSQFLRDVLPAPTRYKRKRHIDTSTFSH